MFSLILLAGIVLAALVLFVSGWLSVDVVGLLVLATLALSGLVAPSEALAGFSSSAVVTIWAMFILSAGLTRTGVAYHIGKPIQYVAHCNEIIQTIVLMIVASLLSAMINTITVAALLLPATMELARRSGRPPARLLMPMAMGCVLGGPFTLISTPPNLLAADALRAAGLTPFALFDFTPITGALTLVGIVFTILCGLRLLPRGTAQNGNNTGLEASYQLGAHVFTIELEAASRLAGRTLAESRLGSALHLTVVGLQRAGSLILSPRAAEPLQAGDAIIVHGQTGHLENFHGHEHLHVESANEALAMIAARLRTARGRIGESSPLVGRTLAESDLRRVHHVHALGLSRASSAVDFRRHRFEANDILLLQGEQTALEQIPASGLLEDLEFVDMQQVAPDSEPIRLASIHVPAGSVLTGHNLVESRLGNAFGLTVAALIRDKETRFMPAPEEVIQDGDLLVVQGLSRDLDVFEGLQELTVSARSQALVTELESQQIGVAEILLSPRTTLAGRTLSDLLFRDHYGLSVLAIWRMGHIHRAGLQDMPLQFGDALLVHGPRQNLEAVARSSDFLVLDQSATQAPRLHKSVLAAAIMLAVLGSAIAGLAPIAIAALSGAAIMVATGCLSMEEAYRAIEWKVVFLVASMLPLGVAIQNTGAAQLGAEALVALVGHLGPRWVVGALFGVTVLGTQIIPTSALVVLMAPVALSTAASLGISPHLLMMTVAIGASASYASPLSHPAHLLIMGPGDYTFMDYVKIGVPLTLLVWATAVWLLPIFWPA